MSILIKNCLLNNKKTSIYIEDNIIKEIKPNIFVEAEHKIDATNKAAIPGLINAHTHAAMTLFRGYADDLELHDWLQNYIWPLEAKLTYNDLYWGTKLACIEMIKTGTTCFNDMYFFTRAVAKAVIEAGIRTFAGPVFIDLFDKERREAEIKRHSADLLAVKKLNHPRVIPVVNPHSVYSVSKEGLEWNRDFAKENDMMLHIHLAETEEENKKSLELNKKRPVDYLEELKMLSPKLVAAHCVWLKKDEIIKLAKYDVKIAHNPVSNMKLAVGRALNYDEMKKAGLTVALGTDGCASNNNLDVFESMKFASLMQKFSFNKQTIMPDDEALKLATLNGYKAFALNGGVIEEGKLADLLLIDLNRIQFIPNHNLTSNIVYSANGNCVNTTICDGKILMQNRKVKDEEKIKEKAQEVAYNLIRK